MSRFHLEDIMNNDHSCYVYSVIIWWINIAAIVVSYFFVNADVLIIPLFLVIFIEYGNCITKCNERGGLLICGFFKGAPKLIKAAAILSFFYTFINFLANVYILREGSPNFENGMYYLWDHKFIREITRQEYRNFKIAQNRLGIGHILTFSAIPMVFFSQFRNKE